MTDYDWEADAKDSYFVAIAAKREQWLVENIPGVKRARVIGDIELLQGDCLEIMPHLGPVTHVICDPPYEASLHESKNKLGKRIRRDKGPNLKGLNFEAIDSIRAKVVSDVAAICQGWFIAFCTIEGVAKWAEEINKSALKYKRACIWVKPDSTPQLNGQGPAQGAECFVTAWGGAGHAKWNAGGKRGVYRHNVNPPDRDGRHATEKPWRLFDELLRDFTSTNDTILDPFTGSGTTLVACTKLGRHGIGIELDPDYFDIAVERVTEACRQPDMFVALSPPPKPEQSDMLEALDPAASALEPPGVEGAGE